MQAPCQIYIYKTTNPTFGYTDMKGIWSSTTNVVAYESHDCNNLSPAFVMNCTINVLLCDYVIGMNSSSL